MAAAFEVPREVLRLPEVRRAARQNIPGPPSGRTLRGAESEVEQMHNYISRIGTNLHKAIGNRHADLIRSYRRTLNSRRSECFPCSKKIENIRTGTGYQ